MKKYIFSALIALTGVMTGCDGYLETDYYSGKDANSAVASVDNANVALNGVYSIFYDYRFAGNYAVTFGDIPTDLSYWNGETAHFDDIYRYSFDENDLYLDYIWYYGFRTVNNASRLIESGDSLANTNLSDDDRATLESYIGQARALRAFANFYMVNVYGHQYKVNGQDFGSSLGLPVSDKPVQPYQQVKRNTVAETYASIVNDLTTALTNFQNAGSNAPSEKTYITAPAVKGLLARVYLYEEDWANAKKYAQEALDDAGISGLAHTTADYRALYTSTGSNNESLFWLAIDQTHEFSAESAGNYWNTYCYSPSTKLQGLYDSSDVRTSIMTWDESQTSASAPYYAGGKYGATKYGTNGVSYVTNYLISAPEMYLIIAEANIKQGNLNDALTAILPVAERDTKIQSTADLPQTLDGLYSFLKDERARELFQEGHRLWDLRRWGDKVSVYAYGAPDEKFQFNNYDISDLVFPIPADEINAHYGVEQNDWANTLPSAQ